MSVETGAVFVDTNVLVYALGGDATEKGRLARGVLAELMAEDRLRTSTQVMQELFVVLTRKARGIVTAQRALDLMDELAAWPVFQVSYETVRAAVLLHASASLSFWDALVVVAASRSGCGVLYTEDLQHGREVLGVRVVNPFIEMAAH